MFVRNRGAIRTTTGLFSPPRRCWPCLTPAARPPPVLPGACRGSHACHTSHISTASFESLAAAPPSTRRLHRSPALIEPSASPALASNTNGGLIGYTLTVLQDLAAWRTASIEAGISRNSPAGRGIAARGPELRARARPREIPTAGLPLPGTTLPKGQPPPQSASLPAPLHSACWPGGR